MDLILKYFTNLNSIQISKFYQLNDIYINLNSKVNLISRKDIKNIYLKHVLYSISIAKYFKFKPNDIIMDVGTGGGFPGIPLAILYPDVSFHLIDSTFKKINCVNIIIQELGLNNVITKVKRVEDIKHTYDFIVSRGVKSLKILCKWLKGKLNSNYYVSNNVKNGLIYLKGGDISEDIFNFPYLVYYNIKDIYSESFFSTKKIVFIDYTYFFI